MFKLNKFAQCGLLANLLLLSGYANAGTALEFVDANRTANGSLTLWEDVGSLNGQSIDVVIRVNSVDAGGAVAVSTAGDNARVRLNNGSTTGAHQASVSYEFYVADTFNLTTGLGTAITIVPFGVFQDIDSDSGETAIFDKADIAQYTVEGGTGGGTGASTIVDNDDGTNITFTSTGSFGTDTRNSILIDFKPVTSIDVTYTVTGGGRNFNFDGDIDTSFNSDDTTQVDMTAPSAPSVNTISTNDPTPTITGNAEPLSTVTVVVGGATFTTIAAADGTWSIDTSITPTSGTFNPNTNGANDVNVTSTDQADNTSVADGTSAELNIDTMSPSLVIQNAPSSTNSAYTVTLQFSEDVTGFTTDDITVGNGAASNLVQVDANTYTALITPATQGSVTIDVAASIAIDQVGNNNTAATQVASNFDNLQPSVAIQNVPANSNSAFTATFEFSENVTGFTQADIDVFNANISNFIAIDGNTYTALISPIANGNVALNVNTSVAVDGANNNNTAAIQVISNFDTIMPSVVIQNASANTNAAFTTTFQFSEDVTGFTLSDIALGNATATNFVQVDANTYTALITPATDGAVTIDVAASVAQDATGNNNTLAAQATVNFDGTDPSVVIQNAPANTNAAFTTTFQFSEDVTGFALSDIALGNATATNFVQVDANTYTALITPTADGAVTIDIAASVAQDATGNNNTIAAQATVNFDGTDPSVVIQNAPTNTNAAFTTTFQFSEDVTGFALSDIALGNATATNFVQVDANTYTALITPATDGAVTIDVAASVAQDATGNNNTLAAQATVNFDGTDPSVVIQNVPTSTNAAFTTTFQFSEDVTGFALSDIALGNATATNFVQVDANTYTALITPTADGAVTIDVAASVAQDATGNNNTIAAQATVNFDGTDPSVVIQNAPANTNAAFTTTFQFSEDVTGFALSDIALGNATATNFVQVDANTYTALITPTADGAVTIDVAASVAQDATGNNNTLAAQATVNFDGTDPSVVIQNVPTSTNAAFTTTFQFSEDVTGFALSDIALGNATATNFVQVDANTYTALITPATDGAVTIDVAASVAQDATGNNNTLAAQATVNFDGTDPSVVIQNVPTSTNAAFTTTFQFSEDVTGFALSDIALGNATATNFVQVDANTYTALITPTADGAVTIDVAASVAQDATGNNNTIAAQATVNFDGTDPSVVIQNAPANTNAAFTTTFQFSEDVTGFALSDIALGNATATNFVQVDANTYTALITPTADGAVTIDVAASVAQDATGNNNTLAAQATVNFDGTDPSVVIQNVPTSTNAAFTTTFQFSEDVTGFTLSDIALGNATATNFVQVDANTYTALITPTADGAVTIDVAASVAQDATGNNNTLAAQATVNFDDVLPIVTVDMPPIANSLNASNYSIAGNCSVSDGDVSVTVVGATPETQLVSCTGGVWSATFNVSAIVDGENVIQISVQQTDDAGNSGVANSQTNKDTIAYELSAQDVNSGLDNSPEFTGTSNSPDGSIVTIRDQDGTFLCMATVQNGQWSCESQVPLSAETQTLTAEITDLAGNITTVDFVATIILDSDGDGISDEIEGTGDSDGDGTPDYLDTDSDGDGIPDAEEGADDTDGDGVPDYLDQDSDGDGIPDADEGTADTDGDGTPDRIDSGTDEDFDGIPDAIEGPGDSDNDGIPDYLDSDSDNDGILDSIEIIVSGLDSDNDGIDDTFDVDATGGNDSNGDNVDDDVMPRDTDDDGLANYLDLDSDNDNLPDTIEKQINMADTDQDGVINIFDVDIVGGVDSDNDSIVDTADVDITQGSDFNSNGIDDAIEFSNDHDGDGNADYLDIDSDNDGIPDGLEGGATGFDSSGNGLDDAFDVVYTGGVDVNNDGVDDSIQLVNTDLDAVVDMFDLDSDNDTLLDTVEAQVLDENTDGIADQGAVLVYDPIDTDGDGVRDFRDIDSDNDGLNDIEGTPGSGLDEDGDGQIDITEDNDGDGIDDSVDTNPVERGDDGDNDTDGDGIPAYADEDDDNDGIADVTEGTIDSDGDGIIDANDKDSDNDGLSDSFEALRPAPLGLDDDNDGIDNAYDVNATGGIDADEDGVDDIFSLVDTDSDGVADRLEQDADNDGLSDTTEQVLTVLSNIDSNENGIDDAVDVLITLGLDENNDGIDDIYVSDLDTDNDGLLNYRDVDSDGDGIDDSIEGNIDSDGDGIPDYLDTDSDNDGIDDSIEGVVDTDGDGIPDYIDIDSDNDGVDDSEEGAIDTDGDGISDNRDTDSDNDGILDADEAGDFNNDGIDDRIQAFKQVESAIRGAGNTGLGLLGLLAAFVLARRTKHSKVGAAKIKLEKQHSKSKMKVLILSVLLTLGFNVKSEESCIDDTKMNDSCWFASGGLGVSLLAPDENSSGFNTIDDIDSAFKFTAGYVISEHWFGEISYANLGQAQLAHANPTLPQDMEIDYSALTASAGYWLFDKQDEWNLFIRAGLGAVSTKSNYEQFHEKQNSVQLIVGLGAQWRINEHWILRAEFDGLEKDARYVGLSIGRFFGSTTKKNHSKAAAESVVQGIIEKPTAVQTEEMPREVEALIEKEEDFVSYINHDNDSDGVLNEVDQCPNTFKGKNVNSLGCEILEEITLNIQFDTSSTEIKQEYLLQLSEVSEVIEQYESITITVEGHTDSVGSVKNNQFLSESRAIAVKNKLAELTGLDDESFNAIGLGESLPIVDNDIQKIRYKNRRVVIRIQTKEEV
ncbi:Ig-like domain-containing protein [Brumicola blandensis]|uniref:Ig-like domain-containing protein n=1 Tax=Brumicola blandensis TaxID=3075611 RepID=A0AAW8R373_9ALTE|nr:Ig-like domain-containing protein [Alteromonas sp. W409]MDT0583637.1 Ig-like domain-containing protein [Alteromonas sp. W409]